MVPEGTDAFTVGGNGMIGEEAADHLPQPLPLFWNRLVHPPFQVFLDRPEFGWYAVAARMALQLERAVPAAPTKMGESKKVEGFRFA